MEVDGLAAFGMEDVMVRVSLGASLYHSSEEAAVCGAGLDSLSERSRNRKQVGVHSVNTLRWVPHDGISGASNQLRVTSESSCTMDLLSPLPIPILPSVLQRAVQLVVQTAIESVRPVRDELNATPAQSL
jgi:hypothetical protein